MTDRQFKALIGVGAVCCVAIVAIAGCVKHISSVIFDSGGDELDDGIGPLDVLDVLDDADGNDF